MWWFRSILKILIKWLWIINVPADGLGSVCSSPPSYVSLLDWTSEFTLYKSDKMESIILKKFPNIIILLYFSPKCTGNERKRLNKRSEKTKSDHIVKTFWKYSTTVNFQTLSWWYFFFLCKNVHLSNATLNCISERCTIAPKKTGMSAGKVTFIKCLSYQMICKFVLTFTMFVL